MENQELKFKFSTKDSVKNLAEAKIIIGRKKLFLSRLVIILIISIIALTFILYVIDLYEYFNRFEPLVRSTLSHIDALNEPPSRQ